MDDTAHHERDAREAILLYHLDGFTPNEISDRLRHSEICRADGTAWTTSSVASVIQHDAESRPTPYTRAPAPHGLDEDQRIARHMIEEWITANDATVETVTEREYARRLSDGWVPISVAGDLRILQLGGEPWEYGGCFSTLFGIWLAMLTLGLSLIAYALLRFLYAYTHRAHFKAARIVP